MNTDDTGRNTFLTNGQVFCSHAPKLQKFTWQSFWLIFVWSSTLATQLEHSSLRAGSAHHLDQTNTSFLHHLLWMPAYDHMLARGIDLNSLNWNSLQHQTRVKKWEIISRSELVLPSWKTVPNIFLELFNKSHARGKEGKEETDISCFVVSFGH